MVTAQVELGGQLLETPGVQVICGPGVAMHWPTQLRTPSGKQVPVAMHVEPVGQAVAPLIVRQEINGGGVYID